VLNAATETEGEYGYSSTDIMRKIKCSLTFKGLKFKDDLVAYKGEDCRLQPAETLQISVFMILLAADWRVSLSRASVCLFCATVETWHCNMVISIDEDPLST